MAASLEPIPNVAVPADLGQVIPLEGGPNPQAYSAMSDNPNVQAMIVNGPFLTIDVSHESSGPGDPAFTGSMTFQLFENLTPTTVRRILALVNQGFYTSPTENPNPSFTNLPSKNFHRIAPGFPGPNDFIVQGGSKNGNGTGEITEPGFPFNDEFVPSLVFTGSGQLAMANAGDDTNGSQFFVTTDQPRFLDFQHTIFGQLVEGQDILQLMTQVSRTEDNVPVSPVLISGTRVSQSNSDGTLLLDTTAANAGQSAMVRVTAVDPSDGSTATQSFQVNVAPNTENQRPFLGPVSDRITRPNQPAVFQLSATSTNPGDELTFAIGGGVAEDGTFAPVQNATASVDSQGLVTVTPNQGFTGVIDLLVGVRDQVNRADDPEAVANYDTQELTLTVTTNNQPTATPVTASTVENEPVMIQLAGQTGNPDSGQTLDFELTGLPVNGLISDFNEETGTLTYTPSENFAGTDFFTYRVRDVGEPTPTLESQEATATINVEPGQPMNVKPTATPQTLTVPLNTPVPVQLSGETGNPDTGQTLNFSINTEQTRGTITGFDEQTGTFTYVPPTNFVGTDTMTFTVTDVGPPGPNLQSDPATVTFNIVGAEDTGAVRQIGSVLLVSPPPGRLINPEPNQIGVGVVDGRIVVTINGVLDVLRPQVDQLERVVVYGAKASDEIVVSPDVPLLVTLDGGLGGINTLQGNDLPSRLHGWFGRNTLQGGLSRDELIGRMGHVRFLPSEGDDLLFAGDPNLIPQRGEDTDDGQGIPPSGQFFRFVNGRLVPIPTPPPRAKGRIILDPPPQRPLVPGLNLPNLPNLGQGQLPVNQTLPGQNAGSARAALLDRFNALREQRRGDR